MARKQIRKLLKREYESQRPEGGYEAVAASWGLSGGMVWRIVNEKNYWPADPEIRRRIEIQARNRGIVIGKRGRKKDLWAMDPVELKWRMQNREKVA